jgi:hypothetical protein
MNKKPAPIKYEELERWLFNEGMRLRRYDPEMAKMPEALLRMLRYIQRGEFHVFGRGSMTDRIKVTDEAPYGASGDLDLPGK